MDPDTAGHPPLDWPLGRLLSTAARMVEHEWNTHLEAMGLTHAGLLALDALGTGSRTQRDLASACHVEEQTMRRVLERLERTGYVRRTREIADRRRLAVVATAAGRQAHEAALAGDVADTLVAGKVTDPERLRAQLAELVGGLIQARRHRSDRATAANHSRA